MAEFASITNFVDNSFYNTDVGFLKPSRFETKWNKLPTVGGYSDMESKLQQNIETISTPGFSISASEHAYNNKFTERDFGGTITATFFESGNLELKSYFWNWMEMIQGKQDQKKLSQRSYFVDIVGSLEVSPILNRVDYKTELDINKNRKEVFGEVFPTNVDGYSFNVGSDNEITKISVSFKYRFYKIVKSNDNKNFNE